MSSRSHALPMPSQCVRSWNGLGQLIHRRNDFGRSQQETLGNTVGGLASKGMDAFELEESLRHDEFHQLVNEVMGSHRTTLRLLRPRRYSTLKPDHRETRERRDRQPHLRRTEDPQGDLSVCSNPRTHEAGGHSRLEFPNRGVVVVRTCISFQIGTRPYLVVLRRPKNWRTYLTLRTLLA